MTDLGTVAAPEAARFLLDLARTGTGRAAEEAIFPAALADSVTVWPDLLKIARDGAVPTHVRNQAVFWLSQAAGDAVVKDLRDLVDDDNVDRDVREHAVFALSQEPRATIHVEVRADSIPVTGAKVTVNGAPAETDRNGVAIASTGSEP